MTECDLDTSVPDWIIEHPTTLAVFQELGIDCGCGGKSFAYSCHQQGLDPQAVLTRLLDCLEVKQPDFNTKWQRVNPSAICSILGGVMQRDLQRRCGFTPASRFWDFDWRWTANAQSPASA